MRKVKTQKEDIRIYIVCHKPTPLPKTPPFVPIQVGNGKPIPGVVFRDNMGDNIAKKNPNFCELTAQYWIWKNVQADVVGLCHYRRIPSFSGCLDGTFSDFSKATLKRFGWTPQVIKGLLTRYDILMPPCWAIFPPGEPGHIMTPYQFHAYEHRESDIAATLKVIHDLTPEMDVYAHQALCVDTTQCFGNICVMRKALFDDYSAWLFKILFELERRIELPKNKEQARVFGFLSERLIMVWLAYAKDKFKARVWFSKMTPLGVFDTETITTNCMVPARASVTNPKLSVIIPVYNAAKYLPKCLQSVCTQCEESIEIICVNDGSTDGSKVILEQFAAKDKRIRIVNQSNHGLGAARNRGVEEAKGEYLAFVDSDDWVDRYIWMRTLRKANRQNLDMVIFEPQDIISETGEQIPNDWNETRFPNRCYAEPFTWRDIGRSPFDTCCYAPNRIIRRAFFGERRFPEGVRYEDAAIHLDLLLSAKRLGAFACPFYFYRIRQGSLAHSTGKHVLDHLKIFNAVAETLQQKGLSKELNNQFLHYVAMLLLQTYSLWPTPECLESLQQWLRSMPQKKWAWQTSGPLARLTAHAILKGNTRFLSNPYTSPLAAVALALDNRSTQKRVRRKLKQWIPYGLMRRWLAERYGMVIDEPLMAYPGFFKRAKRMVKFVLPYGLVEAWKHADDADTQTGGGASLVAVLRLLLRPRSR